MSPWIRCCSSSRRCWGVPLVFAHADKSDYVDLIYRGIAAVNVWFNRLLSATETGRLRWYAATIVGGAIIVIALVVVLR